jgi:hypothetical protein
LFLNKKALHVAIRFDHVELVKALLALRAFQPPTDPNDDSIKISSKIERRKSLKRLSNGILGVSHSNAQKLYDALNVNAVDGKGNTRKYDDIIDSHVALHLAINALQQGKARSMEIVKALVSVKGVKLDIKNNNNETAKQCAKKCNITLK